MPQPDLLAGRDVDPFHRCAVIDQVEVVAPDRRGELEQRIAAEAPGELERRVQVRGTDEVARTGPRVAVERHREVVELVLDGRHRGRGCGGRHGRRRRGRHGRGGRGGRHYQRGLLRRVTEANDGEHGRGDDDDGYDAGQRRGLAVRSGEAHCASRVAVDMKGTGEVRRRRAPSAQSLGFSSPHHPRQRGRTSTRSDRGDRPSARLGVRACRPARRAERWRSELYFFAAPLASNL